MLVMPKLCALQHEHNALVMLMAMVMMFDLGRTIETQ